MSVIRPACIQDTPFAEINERVVTDRQDYERAEALEDLYDAEWRLRGYQWGPR